MRFCVNILVCALRDADYRICLPVRETGANKRLYPRILYTLGLQSKTKHVDKNVEV